MGHTEVKYAGGKKFIAKNRKHTVTIDLPSDFGGSDKGPTPPELFIDAIGSCMGVYIITYCNTVGLNTEGLTIKIDWEKELKEKPAYLKKIDVKIDLPNAEVGVRKEALLKIAHSCLVHQTIKRNPEIHIDLAVKT